MALLVFRCVLSTQYLLTNRYIFMKYADLYLLPLPEKNLDAYKKLATRFGKVIREHGALGYREFIADDLVHEGTLSFEKVVKPKEGEVIIAAVVDFKSRAHRDQVMKKMFKDPRMQKMMEEPMLMNAKRMSYGGFKAIVTA